MILKKLTLKNFLIYREVYLDLSGVKLTSIVGQFKSDSRKSNGTGKTALLESIRYVLFDQTRSKQKIGIVHQGAKSCEVELSFEIGHNKLKIIRTRSAKGTSTARLWVDGKLAGDKISIVNETIKKYIGLDADLFDLVYFFKQRDQFGFAQATPSERKNVLSKVFKMDLVTKCLDVSKIRLSDANQSHQQSVGNKQSTKERLSSFDSETNIQNRIDQTLESLSGVEIRKDFLQGYIKEFASELSEYKSTLQSFSDKVSSQTIECNETFTAMQCLVNDITASNADAQMKLSECDRIRSQVESLETQLVSHNEEKIDNEIKSLSSEYSEIVGKIAVVESDLSKCDNITDSMKRQIGIDCPTCYQKVGVDHVERITSLSIEKSKRSSKSLVELTKHSNKIQSSIDKAVAIKRSITTSNSAKQQLITTKSHLKTLEKVEENRVEKCSRMQIERDKLSAKHSELSAKLTSSNISDTKYKMGKILDAMNHSYQVLLANFEFSTNEVIRLSGILVAEELELTNRDKAKLDYLRAVELVNSSRNDSLIYKHISDAFGKNGIQAIMIENAIGIIEQFTNDILTKMQTRFVVSLRTQKEIKSGEQRETLDIIVFDNGIERPFENYSGGEQTLINLSIRLALSRIISSLHGVEMKSLFLDEVLAELDEINREEAVKVIAFLSKSYEQIFVVSHTDEIKDLIDSALVIQRHDLYSEVRLTDGRSK